MKRKRKEKAEKRKCKGEAEERKRREEEQKRQRSTKKTRGSCGGVRLAVLITRKQKILWLQKMSIQCPIFLKLGWRLDRTWEIQKTGHWEVAGFNMHTRKECDPLFYMVWILIFIAKGETVKKFANRQWSGYLAVLGRLYEQHAVRHGICGKLDIWSRAETNLEKRWTSWKTVGIFEGISNPKSKDELHTVIPERVAWCMLKIIDFFYKTFCPDCYFI